jgi:hypothetical protein
MKISSTILIVLLTASISFGFTSAPQPSAGKPLDFKYIQIAKVDVNGNVIADANLTWHDIGVGAVATSTAGPNNTYRYAKPDEWTWVQYSIYFHGKDGNDANVGQCDVNMFGSNTYGGEKLLFRSTVHAGDQALSHNPATGLPLRTNLQPDDPNTKWANADANFFDTSDLAVIHGGTTGTTSTTGILSYTEFTTQKFRRVQINNITPVAKIDYVYVVMTGGK